MQWLNGRCLDYPWPQGIRRRKDNVGKRRKEEKQQGSGVKRIWYIGCVKKI